MKLTITGPGLAPRPGVFLYSFSLWYTVHTTMKKSITLENQTLEYSLRLTSRSRSVRLSFYNDGRIVVSAPKRITQKFIESFLLKNSEWILSKVLHFKSLQVGKPLPHTKKEIAHYKEQTRALVTERLLYFNQFYGFSWKKIAIRNQKTRWGSCSKQGNLNFNYKISLLPSTMADYIIVHELCHLGEFNHSQNFWNLVAETIPNHVEIRAELKKNNIAYS